MMPAGPKSNSSRQASRQRKNQTARGACPLARGTSQAPTRSDREKHTNLLNFSGAGLHGKRDEPNRQRRKGHRDTKRQNRVGNGRETQGRDRRETGKPGHEISLRGIAGGETVAHGESVEKPRQLRGREKNSSHCPCARTETALSAISISRTRRRKTPPEN